MRTELGCAIALLMVGCSSLPTAEPDAPLETPSITRSGMGYLTPAEAAYMGELAWPQTYSAMKGTFGVAHRSTDTADVYRVESTNQEVWVFYNGSTAIRYEVR
ncbi:hypothetical protein [Almyronema epifaneia]|uniref:Lipoprotein SmpA/OmlA domain-containing protein n=1 Tax=Almyronema epifaneia S1 TaxID=2991925 RepID=A0ABW6IJL4_9CYAN